VFPHDRESRHRVAVQPSAGGDASVGARIARARRDAGLTQRALADLIGVRLWVVDRWESGAGAVPPEQLDTVATATHRTLRWLETGVDERAVGLIVSEPIDGDAGTEETQRELDERIAEIEEARREVHERLAEIEQREAALRMQEQELREVRAAQAEDRRRFRERLAGVERADTPALTTAHDVEHALAQADELRSELERERAGHAELEEARRQVESSRAEVTERERIVAECEARFAARTLGLRADGSDVKSLAQWLTDSVKAAAKREAESVVKAAREQARQILADARAGHQPPGEDTRR